MSDLRQIVIARLVAETRVTSTAGIDLGRRPLTVTEWVPKAALWLASGDESDRLKAVAWAERQRVEEGETAWCVVSLPVDEPDPLGKAKDIARSALRGISQLPLK